MPTSRQLIYIGLPVIILLMTVTALQFIKQGAEKSRMEIRNDSAATLESIIELAEADLEKAKIKRETEKKELLGKLQTEALLVAEKTSMILYSAIRDIDQKERAARSNNQSGLEMIVSSLWNTPFKADALNSGSPASVIIENEIEIKNLLPKDDGLIAITSAQGTLIWQNRLPSPATKYTPAVIKRCEFNWNNQRAFWNISVHLPVEGSFDTISANEIFAALNEDMPLQKLFSEKFTLALTDANGNIILTTPKGAFPIKNSNSIMLGQWHEIDKGVYDKARMRLLSGKQSRSSLNMGILAQAIILEPTDTDWLLTQVAENPALFILPAAILIIAAAIFVLSIWKSGSRRQKMTVTPSPANVPLKNIKLVRKGGREIPEDADIVLAEVGEDGNSVEVRAIKGAKYPAPDRESNLVRLREIYFHGRDAMHLEKQVRSEILRGLLMEVGRRSDKEMAEKGGEN